MVRRRGGTAVQLTQQLDEPEFVEVTLTSNAIVVWITSTRNDTRVPAGETRVPGRSPG